MWGSDKLLMLIYTNLNIVLSSTLILVFRLENTVFLSGRDF